MTDKNVPIVHEAHKNALALTSQARESLKQREKDREARTRNRENLANRETALVFAVDATASRQHFWSDTKEIQSSMFISVVSAGGKLLAQLVSFGGSRMHSTVWHDNPLVLCEEMEKVKCEPGETQIKRVMRHTLEENARRKVDALVLVGDSCEEHEDDLVPIAAELKRKGVAVFVFDDAQSAQRDGETTNIFLAIANAAGGHYIPFTMEDVNSLGDKLRTVAVIATGDEASIRRAPSHARTPAGQEFARNMAAKALLALPKPGGPGS